MTDGGEEPRGATKGRPAANGALICAAERWRGLRRFCWKSALTEAESRWRRCRMGETDCTNTGA